MSRGRTGGLLVECVDVDIGGGSNDKDTDCCVAAVVWSDVTLLPCKLEGKNGSWELLLNAAGVDWGLELQLGLWLDTNRNIGDYSDVWGL